VIGEDGVALVKLRVNHFERHTLSNSPAAPAAPALPASSATPAISRRKYLTGAAWGLFAISIWVGWILLTRYGVTTSLAPIDIVALRFTCAGLLLAPIVLRKGLGIKQIGWKLWLIIITGAGVPYVMIASSGLLYAPAAHAGALVPGTMPLWTALLAMIFLKEKISGSRIFGLSMIPIGIVIFVGAGLTHFETGYWRGHLFFIAAAICWASFTTAMRSASAKGFTALQAASVVSVVWGVLYVPFYWFFLPHRIAEAPMNALIIQTIYQGIFVSIISLFAYARAVSILGASLGASFASLVPVLAMLAAIPLLGEVPKPADYLGIAAVTIGVFLSSGAHQVFAKRSPTK
jgi:drug/metabolite transporter (DMT)-like permease